MSTDLGKSHMKPGIRIMAGFRGKESVGSQVGRNDFCAFFELIDLEILE